MLTLTSASSALTLFPECKTQRRRFSISAAADYKFPSFLPKQMEEIKDPFARKLATRIERLPVNVSFSEKSIMSSCVKPLIQSNQNPVVLLHSFDSSCLEWRYTFPLLEEAGLETWAIDILGWGFSNLERIKSCDVASKREHFYQIGKLHCLYPWWEDATVSFMISGGYNVSRQIDQVMQKTLIIWGEDDQIISNKLAVRLHFELPNSNIRQIPDCGHLPHVEKPDSAARLILEFMQNHSCQKKAQLAPTEEVVY
uniref:AB hydrolase-1 domain-containing protein n=1 Tax=Gossypium raimondii TaxID=29730 RepID=A0A0D2T2B7_GOSRA|nr:hypothetical protein B456_008G177500 [Gossypium raimondii]